MTTKFQTTFAGQGESPIKLVYMYTDETYSTITTAGFLNKYLSSGYEFSPTDVVYAFYGTNSSTFGIFTVSKATNGTLTLVLSGPLSSTLPSTQIFVGNASNVATARTMSGDATLSNTGALIIANSAVTTAKINNNAVTLAKLASGITPSHITVYAGRITWSGSGASLTTTVNGVLATDQVVASIRSAPTQAAYLVSATTNNNQVILTLSAANTSNDAVITYNVLRAVS